MPQSRLYYRRDSILDERIAVLTEVNYEKGQRQREGPSGSEAT